MGSVIVSSSTLKAPRLSPAGAVPEEIQSTTAPIDPILWESILKSILLGENFQCYQKK